MASLIRFGALLFFAMLLQVTAGSTVNAASMTSVSQQCAVSRYESVIQAVVVHDDAAFHSTAQDCQNGNCSGSTCHCSCHGLVATLPVAPSGLHHVPMAIHNRPSLQYFAAVTLLPPVPPPQA